MSDIPRRFAAIDCGTNTFTMLVVDVASELAAEGGGRLRWRECFRLRLPVRLGEGGFKAGQIAPDRFARGLDALGVFRRTARAAKAAATALFPSRKAQLRPRNPTSPYRRVADLALSWAGFVTDSQNWRARPQPRCVDHGHRDRPLGQARRLQGSTRLPASSSSHLEPG